MNEERQPDARDDDARAAVAKGMLREQRRAFKMDLLQFMSNRDLTYLVGQLRKVGTERALQLAGTIAAARRGSEGRVVVTIGLVHEMLQVLPKRPTLRHLRKTLGSITAAGEQRFAESQVPREPNPALLANPASGGRTQRVRRRSGLF